MHQLQEIAQRRHDAARLAGSAALAIFGQFTVDAPSGYFGPTDRVTPAGLVFLLAVVVLAAVGVALRLAGRRGYQVPAFVQLGLVLAAFIPPLASDPVIAGTEVIWHLLLFGQLAFRGTAGHDGAILPAKLDDGEARERRDGPAVRHLLCVSVAISVAALGFRLGDRVPAHLICLVMGAVGIGLAVPFMIQRLRTRSIGPLLVAGLLIAAAATLHRPEVALGLLAAAQAAALVLLWIRTHVFVDLLDTFYRRPAYLVMASFMVLIGLGSLFLSFPVASAGSAPVQPVDAIFTATSAACVTGLIVLDTPTAFSTFGQVVILLLIQVGGLNIMVLSAFAAVVLGRSLGLRGEGAMRDILDLQPARSVRRLVAFIGVGTLAAEALGAAGLAALYGRHGYGPASAIWHGIFHAVSAFCNAGFSLHSDSLIRFARDPAFLFLMATLITVGGLGFGVLNYGWIRLTGRRRGSHAVHARIVLAASVLLVIGGALVYGFSEWNNSLAGLPALDRVANSLFQSVTQRTAGFNSVATDNLNPATVLAMLVWMFIGASPGGTGGGIKTTTAVVLIGSVMAILGRRSQIVLFRRRMSLGTINRSTAIATVSFIVVTGGAFALLATQAQPFESLFFEAVSAFGTVGLSLGSTAELDGVGKVIIMVLMLAGRVGPLTLALLVGRVAASRVSHPDARIMVG